MLLRKVGNITIPVLVNQRLIKKHKVLDMFQPKEIRQCFKDTTVVSNDAPAKKRRSPAGGSGK